jgi:hypothetical protein
VRSLPANCRIRRSTATRNERQLADEFPDDDKVKSIVKRERAYIDDWMAEHSDEEQQDRPKRTLGAVETPEEFDDARSIFDDVDD